MPEEKKEKKSIIPVLFGSNEKKQEKKDSFTFSDKIKNSKQPGSKSFANRISSKVGSDGKPKRTLFERTKRDAPFIIAAIIALLLLPFLYKYSGQVSEEPIVAPSVEDNIFDPDRYGFDTVAGDPEGQIAQLSGRDPLSLIKGFGGVEEPETYDSLGDFDRSGLSDNRSYSDTTEERNTTNIYKSRAPQQTRAAIKRTPTKIGKLSSAGLTGRGGGKLGVGMWGGGLKSAAKRVKSETPQNSPKPVSLQPLTSAGKPSRSYFGQGAAEQARRSKDAMSKANAMQALADAQFRPIEPGKIGGIAGGDLGGPGGGNGNLERSFAFNGKEPWWWDMMKRRSQMEWEKKFNHVWGWIDFGVELAKKFLDPFVSCLITGTDDWSMGNMFGAVAGSGDENECGGLTEKQWEAQHPDVPFGKDACREFYQYKIKPDIKDPWSSGNKASVDLGFFGQRWDCLSNGLYAGRYGAGQPGLSEISSGGECAGLNTTHNYEVRPEGKALKWNTYHYIVARNYLPKAIQDVLKGKDIKTGEKPKTDAKGNVVGYEDIRSNFSGKEMNLCSEFNNPFRKAKHSGGGVGASGEIDYSQMEKAKIDELRAAWSAVRTHTTDRGNKNNTTLQYAEGSVEPESLNDACVIYVAHSTLLDWEQEFKSTMVDMFENLLRNVGYSDDNKKLQNKALEAFDQLDLMFIESVSMEDKIGTTHNVQELLPLPYWVFNSAYLVRKGTTTKDKSEGGYHTNLDRRKFRQADELVHGARCFFNRSVSLSCQDDSRVATDENTTTAYPTATVTFRPSYKGGQQKVEDIKNEKIEVRATFATGEGTSTQYYRDQIFHNPTKVSTDTAKNVVYGYKYTTLSGNKEFGHQDVNGRVVWTMYRNGVLEQTRTCSFNNSADGEPVTPKITPRTCTNGDKKWENAQKSASLQSDNYCPKYQECVNGEWAVEWKKVSASEDPDCADRPEEETTGNGTPQTVNLYSSFTQFPVANEIMEAKYRDGFSEQQTPANKQWDACRLGNSPMLLAVDPKTESYMQAAKDKFDRAHADQQITLNLPSSDKWTVANLVDAMLIDPQNGQVPANTVCMLGKTIGAKAKDPQVGNQGFDNLFGAFLAYITVDAASFPSKKTYNENGDEISDLRFAGNGATKPYYWGGYTDKGKRDAYLQSIQSFGWNTFPLKGLAREPLRLEATHASDILARNTFHSRYKDLMTNGVCNYGDQTIDVNGAISYIGLLCQHGDQNKPAGMGYDAYIQKHPEDKGKTGTGGAHHLQDHSK